MIIFENTEVYGWEHAIRGMRNPMNSWDRMDSNLSAAKDEIGDNDLELMLMLANGGPVPCQIQADDSRICRHRCSAILVEGI